MGIGKLVGFFGLGLTAIELGASPGLAQTGEQIEPMAHHHAPLR
jgi:hypothetical protein